MISTGLAQRLRDAGLVWVPVAGDAFQIMQPDFEGDVFTVSDMTIEPHHYPSGTVLGFNGTTEWALDSVEQDKAVWLPREDQLRDLLGESFVSLEQLEGGYAVSARGRDGAVGRHADIDAERAYARAVLAQLETSAPEA